MVGTLALAAVGGTLGLLLHVPAGGIIGSVATVGTTSVATGKVPELPGAVRRAALILTGTVIGSGVGPHLLASLASFWLAALLMAAWIIAVALGLGWWLGRRNGLDPATALFCFTPGGLGEMLAVAEALGADGRVVTVVGLMRVLTTVVAVPLVLGYLVLRP